MKKNSALTIVCVFLLLPFTAICQDNVWNTSTLKFSTDIASLENMSAAAPVIFPGGSSVQVSDTMSFPGGFRFRYGLDNFSKFSVSAYGALKFGGKIRSAFASSQDTIIVPFTNSSSIFTSSYKIIGTSPARKFIVEWSGVLLQSAQQVKVQLWLYERTGKIEIVNQGLTAYSFGPAYSVYCKTKISGLPAQAFVDVKPIPQAPVISYAALITNFEGIPANTVYRFEPDTLKPATPDLTFSNVLPGCFSVNVKDQSINEAFFILEKLAAFNNYKPVQQSSSPTGPATGAVYTYNQTGAKPDSIYGFRAFASNGFLNSDTIIRSQLTPMPMINGVKSIPGDYPSINALLQDAACKHLGPDLVIELQPSYSYTAEAGAVRFKPGLFNKFLSSLTVRPAASAVSLVINNTGAYPMFAIDSVPHVHIDGRAGGVGTTNNLTLNQADGNQPAVAYFNNANEGGIHYVNVQGHNTGGGFGLLYVSNTDPLQYPAVRNYAVNAITINNCKIGPATGLTNNALIIEGGENNTVRSNEFFRFAFNAVSIANGGENCRVVKNRVYQPEALPLTASTGAMIFSGMGNNFLADSNRVGGSVATWGMGLWTQSLTAYPEGYALLRISAGEQPGTTVYARDNDFGNVSTTGTQLYAINVKGNSVISNNHIGTADSSGSMVSDYFIVPVNCSYAGKSVVSDNFVSGIKSNAEIIMASAQFVDTAVFSNNDLGGSDSYYANTANGQVSGIGTLRVKKIIVTQNQIRGLSSVEHSVLGIEDGWTAITDVAANAIIDSNSIHHLDGRRSVMGMFLRLNTERSNSLSYNIIYALNGRGPNSFVGGENPTQTTGIATQAAQFHVNSGNVDTGYVTISGNRMFGFDYTSNADLYPYTMTGIAADGYDFRVANNMISLGLNMAGAVADSVELSCAGINIQASKNAFIEHNSLCFDGKGKWENVGIAFPAEMNANENKVVYLSNNIVQINRNSTTTDDTKNYFSGLGASTTSIVSNKNIWYSSTDPNINAKMQQWRSNCHCDSLSFINDPGFINPAGDSSNINLHLQAITPADAGGTPSVIPSPLDIDGQLRNSYSPVDIGADAITPCAGSASEGISITSYQETIEICPGSNLLLTAALGGAITQLQWQKNLNNIPGANALTYLVTTPGSYRLVGKTSCGQIASKAELILVQLSVPAIALEAVNPAPYCDSSSVEMKVAHANYSLTALQFKWFKNNIFLPGKITDHETIDGIRFGDHVRIEVTNITSCNSITVKDSVEFYNMLPAYRPQISITSFRDSLFSLTNKDTLKFHVTDAGSNIPEVIYITPVSQPLQQLVGDSMFIFTNIPYSIKFKLRITGTETCFTPDSTEETTIYVSNAPTAKTYVFNGNGNWDNPSNWSNDEIPPSPLPFNVTVIINTGSLCFLNVPFTLGIGAHLNVKSGANFIVQGNLIQQ